MRPLARLCRAEPLALLTIGMVTAVLLPVSAWPIRHRTFVT